MAEAQRPPTLIIVTGHPGAGKTTLARALSRELRLPMIHRDGLKEAMFDALGWSDREWSRKLGGASYELLYYVMRAMLSGGASMIVESNFDSARASTDLAQIIDETGATPIQVVCQTEPAVLFDRYVKRAGSAERHPGHVDLVAAKDLKERLLQGKYQPLALDCPLLVVDTTDFANVDAVVITSKLRDLLTKDLPLS